MNKNRYFDDENGLDRIFDQITRIEEANCIIYASIGNGLIFQISSMIRVIEI